MRHKIIWYEPKGKLKNQIFYVLNKNMSGHSWHGHFCGSCCDLVRNLEKLFKRYKRRHKCLQKQRDGGEKIKPARY